MNYVLEWFRIQISEAFIEVPEDRPHLWPFSPPELRQMFCRLQNSAHRPENVQNIEKDSKLSVIWEPPLSLYRRLSLNVPIESMLKPFKDQLTRIQIFLWKLLISRSHGKVVNPLVSEYNNITCQWDSKFLLLTFSPQFKHVSSTITLNDSK